MGYMNVAGLTHSRDETVDMGPNFGMHNILGFV